jgi:hypothetical protein
VNADRSPLLKLLAAALAAGVIFWFWRSRLAFAPVPWPDQSAFFLPGTELFQWPPRWRMHSQAAFVPSYDTANFNTMPALPALLGAAARLTQPGLFSAARMARLISLLPLAAFAWLLWEWLSRSLSEVASRRAALLFPAVLGVAALLDPVARWGTQVVRTEAWVALAWILILRELWARGALTQPRERSRSLWKISGLLAAAAAFHFEAIILVPGAALGLYPFGARPLAALREWQRTLAIVAARTLLFLLPWLVYVGMHWALFREQMDTQFARLAGRAPVDSLYALFHTPFSSFGSAASYPKFFNVGKAAWWLLVVLLLNRTTYVAFARIFKAPHAQGAEASRSTAVTWAAAAAFGASIALWLLKYEVWFVTLSHFLLWAWFAAVLLLEERIWKGVSVPVLRVHRMKVPLGALGALYAAVSIFATFAQQRDIPAQYSWRTYAQWVDCVERAIQYGTPASTVARKKIWQPHLPDVLVELAARHPEYDLTRTLDFEVAPELPEKLATETDAIIFSRHFPVEAMGSYVPTYEGPARAEDRRRLGDDTEIPFARWALEKKFRNHACQAGPFWAVISLRSR